MFDLQELERLREERKISQRKLVKQIGVTLAGYQRMINTNDMKLTTYVKVCETLGVSADFLFTHATVELWQKNEIDRIFEVLKSIVKERV